jgi:hypothetical protein
MVRQQNGNVTNRVPPAESLPLTGLSRLNFKIRNSQSGSGIFLGTFGRSVLRKPLLSVLQQALSGALLANALELLSHLAVALESEKKRGQAPNFRRDTGQRIGPDGNPEPVPVFLLRDAEDTARPDGRNQINGHGSSRRNTDFGPGAVAAPKAATAYFLSRVRIRVDLCKSVS